RQPQEDPAEAVRSAFFQGAGNGARQEQGGEGSERVGVPGNSLESNVVKTTLKPRQATKAEQDRRGEHSQQRRPGTEGNYWRGVCGNRQVECNQVDPGNPRKGR